MMRRLADYTTETERDEPNDAVKQRLSFGEEKSSSETLAAPLQSDEAGSKHLNSDEDR